MSLSNYFSSQFQKLKSNLFFQNVALVAGGTATAKIIGLLSAPIITRLYTPEDYGILSVFAAIIAVAGSLSTLRYAITIPLAEKEEMADNLLKLSFSITLGLSLIGSLLVLIFGQSIAEAFSAQQIIPYLWILPIAFLGTGLYEALSQWAIRRKYFRLITRTKISQGVSSKALKIGLGAIGLTPIGLLIGLVATNAAGVIRLFVTYIKDKPAVLSKISLSGIKEAAVRYKRFPIIQSWSQLLLGLGAQLPVLFIAMFYGAKEAGLFGLAHSLISMPMNLLGQSVAQVFYGEIAKYGKSNPDKIYNLSVSIVKKMFFLAIVPIIPIMIAGPWAFDLILGEAWYEAGVYARFLSIIILTRFISSPLANIFNVFEMQGKQLVINVLRLLIVSFVFFISKKIDLSAIDAIRILSFSLSGFYLIVTFIIFSTLKNIKNKS